MKNQLLQPETNKQDPKTKTEGTSFSAYRPNDQEGQTPEKDNMHRHLYRRRAEALMYQ